MTYWWINHSVESYQQHSDLIGKEKRFKGKISPVKNGDKIIYYAIRDRAIIGCFKVVSAGKCLKNDKHWTGDHWVYKIEPIVVGKSPMYVNVKEMLKKVKLDLPGHLSLHKSICFPIILCINIIRGSQKAGT